MFTGIVEEMGRVKEKCPAHIVVEADKSLQGTNVGDSIAVNGVCLTVTSMREGAFSIDITPETLSRTNLGLLEGGDPVNLERPLDLGKGMGGHIVQGHVDGTGRVVSVTTEGNSIVMWFEAPEKVMRYVVEKGFIAVDGVSLTIASSGDSSFAVSLIPFTRDHTVLGSRQQGEVVNLEVDIIAKYVERLMKAPRTPIEILDEL